MKRSHEVYIGLHAIILKGGFLHISVKNMEWYHVERSYGTTEEIIISYSFETFYSYVE